MRLVLAFGHSVAMSATEAEIESIRFVQSPGTGLVVLPPTSPG